MQYYTDGSTSPKNPGNGGCAFVVIGTTKNYAHSGYLGELITNNYAETSAVLRALRFATKYNDTAPTIYTDSEYVIYGLRRISKHRNVLSSNTELWKEVEKLAREFPFKKINVNFVVSHSGIMGNELADCLAYLASKKTEFSLFITKEEMDEFIKTVKREKSRERESSQTDSSHIS